MQNKIPLIAILYIVSTASFASSEPQTQFTEKQIGSIAEHYLVTHPEKMSNAIAIYLAEHPEFLMAAGENLRQRQQLDHQLMMAKLAAENQKELVSQSSPSVGPAKAKAAVIMFFDYQCVYCSKIAPTVETLIKNNPDTRFVFKEFPIFAAKWPVSAFAARVGEAVWQKKGGEAYITYHNALYATGNVEGKLTAENVNRAATPYLNEKELKELENPSTTNNVLTELQNTQTLAKHIGITGTPAFIITPQSGNVDENKISVFPGNTTMDALQSAISKANGE
jgi:protein-disulfide isomerase